MAEEISREVIHVSVRGVVEFILRSGDIDNSGMAPSVEGAMQLGARFHKKIQSMRGTGYMAEVPLSLSYPCEKFDIVTEGRADGIFTEGTSTGNFCIEEIKGTYRNVSKMKQPIPVHLAQAKCYAHMYLETFDKNERPDLIDVKMTYVNMETEKMKEFDYTFTDLELGEWYDGLMKEYEKWADLELSWKPVRQASIKALNFPYEYRSGQKKLAGSVYRTILEGKKLFLEAPTGCGKTLSTLYPSIKAMGEGLCDRIFYLTAKTITRTAPEEAVGILRSGGLEFKTVTLTAKEKICFLEKTDCNPIGCKYAKGHFDRINEALYALVSEQKNFSREVILEYADKYKVCPFELSLDAALFSDGIICDYNYLFDPHARLKRFFESGNGEKYIFLVDEAHNLVPRGRRMYSSEIREEDLKALRKIIRASLEGCVKSKFFKNDYSGKLTKGIGRVLSELKKIKERFGENEVIAGFEEDWYLYETGLEGLVKALERLHGTLSEYMEEREKPGMIPQALRDALLEMFFGAADFLSVFENLGNDYVIYDKNTPEEGFKVILFCTDPGRNIASCLEQGVSSVLFSATMLPIQYYKSLLGGSAEDYEVYAESVFDPSKRGIFISSDLTTRYRDRSDDEYYRTAEYISKIVGARSGNYMIFFPSYAYMHRVLDIYESGFLRPDDEIAVQGERMTEKEREEFLELFEGTGGTLIGFCVMGGIFSEGIDLKGDSLIGVICVGPGLPGVDMEQNILRTYFDGYDRKGYEYAYMYPGMNKVLQAAGRVIRTEEDTGIVALLDKRFLGPEYRRMFPREWTGINVTSLDDIKEKIEDFWEEL